MREQKFTIPNRLASYREIVSTAANNRRVGLKREIDNIKLVIWAIKKAEIEPIKGDCTLHILWVEPRSSRRHAHVSAASVFIEQALIAAGVISDPVQIHAISSTFRVNQSSPRVEVTIEDHNG